MKDPVGQFWVRSADCRQSRDGGFLFGKSILPPLNSSRPGPKLFSAMVHIGRVGGILIRLFGSTAGFGLACDLLAQLGVSINTFTRASWRFGPLRWPVVQHEIPFWHGRRCGDGQHYRQLPNAFDWI